MQVTKQWVAAEFQAIEVEKAKIKVREERLERAIFALADKLDSGKPKNETRSFEVVLGKARFRFSKVAHSVIEVLESVAIEKLGKKIDKITALDVSISKDGQRKLTENWKTLSPLTKKELKPFVEIETYYDPDKLESLYLAGEITKADYQTMTKQEVTFNRKASALKSKK